MSRLDVFYLSLHAQIYFVAVLWVNKLTGSQYRTENGFWRYYSQVEVCTIP